MCSLFPPRSFDGSSPNLVGVCRWTSHLPLRGSFSKRSTGHFHFPLYYICASLTPHPVNGAFCFTVGKQQSLILRLLLQCISTLYVGGPCNCLEGFFFEKVNRSTGQQVKRVNRSMCQRVKRVDGSTGHFRFHYIIYDSRRHQAHTTPLQKAHGV